MENTDGHAGARRAVALLTVAARAETTSASLAEEASKIDIKFTINHPFRENVSIGFFAQVKSGPSYVRKTKRAWRTLNIDKKTVDALFLSGVCGLIIWVPPRPAERVYWHTGNPRIRMSTPIRLDQNQFLSPSIKYDLARVYEHSTWNQASPKLQMSAFNISTCMQKARLEYKRLKISCTFNPLIGNFEITRLAWRHITKRSRASSSRTIALRTVPYLQYFLRNPPDRYARYHMGTIVNGRMTIEKREIVCWYRDALIMDGISCSIMARFNEEISYPTNWEYSSLSDKHVTQKATLSSWWCKPAKTRPTS